MISSLYLNDKCKSFTETWEKARKAMNLFVELKDKEGKGETNFLLGLILIKKGQSLQKSESFKLKGKTKSESSVEMFPEEENDFHRSSSVDDEMNYLNTAKKQFFEIGNQYGVARVSLAIALRKLEFSPYGTILSEEAEKDLQIALKGFTLFGDYQRIITCNLKLGEIMLSKKKLLDAK